MTTTFRLPLVTVSLVRDGTVESGAKDCRTSDDAAKVFRAAIPDCGREHFVVTFLDMRKRVTGVHVVSIGCLSQSLVHPREVFRPAILAGAAAILVGHNHPSGDPEPSADDVALTRRLAQAGMLLGIEVLDHIIVADGSERHVSLRQRGVL